MSKPIISSLNPWIKISFLNPDHVTIFSSLTLNFKQNFRKNLSSLLIYLKIVRRTNWQRWSLWNPSDKLCVQEETFSWEVSEKSWRAKNLWKWEEEISSISWQQDCYKNSALFSTPVLPQLHVTKGNNENEACIEENMSSSHNTWEIWNKDWSID